MIKIEKDLANVPASLATTITNTTHQKRLKIIESGIYDDKFDDRYKSNDIRESLIRIYNHKCAYCEQKIERYNIEHYRPKRIYYWLAFSWDNLLMACPTCNTYKDTHFDLNPGGTRVAFENMENNVGSINNSSATYDMIEQPMMVNPEVSDPHGQIDFQVSGKIYSNNERFNYTIEKCRIDRNYLNDERRKILERFKEDIRSCLLSPHHKVLIRETVTRFVRESQDKKLEFLAFRNYAINNGWLNRLIIDIG